MLRLVLKRIGFGIVTLVGTSFLIFWVNQLNPADFATQLLGREYTQATAEVVRDKYGLYQPLLTRYLAWVGSMLSADFGISWSGQEIGPTVAIRIQRSLWLASLAACLMFPVAIALGIYSALNRYNRKDRVILVTNTVMLSTPEFFVAYIMMALFAVKFELNPYAGSLEPLRQGVAAALHPAPVSRCLCQLPLYE